MLVDLSVTLNQKTPVYPGDPAIKIEPAGVMERDGWNDHVISVNTHVGTHIDAPLHMIADGKTLDQVPVEQFVSSTAPQSIVYFLKYNSSKKVAVFWHKLNVQAPEWADVDSSGGFVGVNEPTADL